LGIGNWVLVIHAVCNFLSDLTPNPNPCSVGEQESKPLSLWGRGLERGSKDKLHIAFILLLILCPSAPLPLSFKGRYFKNQAVE
jgi:hypothetical protein